MGWGEKLRDFVRHLPLVFLKIEWNRLFTILMNSKQVHKAKYLRIVPTITKDVEYMFINNA